MNEQDALAFVVASLRSVWALEVLMVLRRQRATPWRREDIIRETRSSQIVVAESIVVLQAAALICEEDGLYRYSPSTLELDRIADHIERLYAAKPLTVVKAILAPRSPE